LSVHGTVEAGPPSSVYKLVWFDEFESEQLDLTKWGYYDTGPRKSAVNTPDAVTVGNGCLVISTYTQKGIHYTGMVTTEGKFETKNGYWEARMKFSDAPGTFSDFWLYTRKLSKPWKPGSNPKNNGVEIDIVEHRVIDENWNSISGINSINLHWGDYEEHHEWDGTTTGDFNIGNVFHVFGLEWTTEYYKFYIDDNLVWTHTQAISDIEQFVIFSTEIVDGGWSGYIPREGYGDKKTSSTELQIDYFRYYAK
jgi:beta-glucanase (GH16 family)